MDPYRILGIPHGSSVKAIKSAYRKIARTYHPDINTSDGLAYQHFANATAAYEHLVSGTKFVLPYPDYEKLRSTSTPRQSPPSSGDTISEKMRAAKTAYEARVNQVTDAYESQRKIFVDAQRRDRTEFDASFNDITRAYDATVEHLNFHMSLRRQQALEDYEKELAKLAELEEAEKIRLKDEYHANSGRADSAYSDKQRYTDANLEKLAAKLKADLDRLRKEYDEAMMNL